MHTDWPKYISRGVDDLPGSNPGGMSGASVQQLRARDGSRRLVLKRSTSAREWQVYTEFDLALLVEQAPERVLCRVPLRGRRRRLQRLTRSARDFTSLVS